MKKYKYLHGGILATIGFLLSPLSWWNDLIINIPLAYGFGYMFSLINKSLFLPAVVVGYWMTNVLGFILLHKGFVKISEKEKANNSKSSYLKDFLISILYTLLIISLFYFKVIVLPKELLGTK